MIGPSNKPDSSNHVVPVISPLPFREYHPAKTGSTMLFEPRGRTAVTPVLTGPLPTTSLPFPEIMVVCPIWIPETSVIALYFPGVPVNGMFRSLARSLAIIMPPLCIAIAMISIMVLFIVGLLFSYHREGKDLPGLLCGGGSPPMLFA